MTESLIQITDLTEAEFRAISRLVRERCGINLHEGKKALVRARLAKRLRALNLPSYEAYVDRVQADQEGVELAAMLDALSTNLTAFFREQNHFALLRERVIPAMLDRHAKDRRLRLWSAGCSSGEEPYSVAITLQEVVPDLARWDAAILATDLSVEMLERASRAVYSPGRLTAVPRQTLAERFHPERSSTGTQYHVRPSTRHLVSFARLNLMDPWPMRGRFDAIFCRNVMIYFDKDTQQRLIDRLWDRLEVGGVLFVGHSESLAGIRHQFRYLQPTVYEKTT
jgi:chemotaxis protein methyltransferase CheR